VDIQAEDADALHAKKPLTIVITATKQTIHIFTGVFMTNLRLVSAEIG
jgi:hypothetical protein